MRVSSLRNAQVPGSGRVVEAKRSKTTRVSTLRNAQSDEKWAFRPTKQPLPTRIESKKGPLTTALS
eukprot:11191042-Lingulodinium_polyedra.AAC.1